MGWEEETNESIIRFLKQNNDDKLINYRLLLFEKSKTTDVEEPAAWPIMLVKRAFRASLSSKLMDVTIKGETNESTKITSHEGSQSMNICQVSK